MSIEPMVIELLATLFIVVFASVAILGHVLLLTPVWPNNGKIRRRMPSPPSVHPVPALHVQVVT